MNNINLVQKPMKRLRVPPNSATSEGRGYIDCPVLNNVLLENAQREKEDISGLQSVGVLFPMKVYCRYVQGFLQPVSFLITSISASTMP